MVMSPSEACQARRTCAGLRPRWASWLRRVWMRASVSWRRLSGAPDKRRQLTEARIQTLRSQLAQRGLNPAQVRLAWQASDGDMTIYRRGPGFQVLAWLQVSP